MNPNQGEKEKSLSVYHQYNYLHITVIKVMVPKAEK